MYSCDGQRIYRKAYVIYMYTIGHSINYIEIKQGFMNVTINNEGIFYSD